MVIDKFSPLEEIEELTPRDIFGYGEDTRREYFKTIIDTVEVERSRH
jgi:hypothetical protein